MTGMLAAVIFMSLFVVININYPFTGELKVSVEPLKYRTRKPLLARLVRMIRVGSPRRPLAHPFLAGSTKIKVKGRTYGN